MVSQARFSDVLSSKEYELSLLKQERSLLDSKIERLEREVEKGIEKQMDEKYGGFKSIEGEE